MQVKVKGILLDVIEKEYEFEGKQGISYQLVVYSNGTLEKIKVSQGTYKRYKGALNSTIELECNIFIKGNYSLSYKEQ